MEPIDRLKSMIEKTLVDSGDEIEWGEVTELPADERAFGVTIDGQDLFITINPA